MLQPRPFLGPIRLTTQHPGPFPRAGTGAPSPPRLLPQLCPPLPNCSCDLGSSFCILGCFPCSRRCSRTVRAQLGRSRGRRQENSKRRGGGGAIFSKMKFIGLQSGGERRLRPAARTAPQSSLAGGLQPLAPTPRLQGGLGSAGAAGGVAVLPGHPSIPGAERDVVLQGLGFPWPRCCPTGRVEPGHCRRCPAPSLPAPPPVASNNHIPLIGHQVTANKEQPGDIYRAN